MTTLTSPDITSTTDITRMTPAAQRPRIAILYKSLPQYRRPFFELLRTHLASLHIDLDLIYGQPAPADAAKQDCVDLPWATRIRNTIIPLGNRNAYWQPALALTKNADLVIVEQANKLLTNYALLALRLLGKRRVAFWGHGKDFQSRRRFPLRESIKRHLVRHVDWWFAYNTISAEAVQSAGFPAEKITQVQNAIDTRRLTLSHATVTPAQIVRLRADLAIRGANVCIYAGALYPDKRLDFLLQSADLLRAADPQFELLVLGNGPQAPLIQSAAATRPWLHYVGPKFDSEKVPYFAASKLLLMPGLVGLVVLDSFALETPLVTTAIDYHSPEIEYLRNNKNGLIVSPADSPAAYAAAVAALLADEPRRQALIAGCREAREQYTIEEMVRRFAEGICSALRAQGVLS
jgi:L-malate glycosyltransferase